jgi:hypothetical protein
MKTLIVKPLGGLANRMRVVEAACSYAHRHNAVLYVLWEKNIDLNAGFASCFENAGSPRIMEINCAGKNLIAKLRRRIFRELERLLRAAYSDAQIYDQQVEEVLNKSAGGSGDFSFFDELAAKNKKVYVETCFGFYPNPQGFRLTVKKDIQEKARKILESHAPVIGVHIRRTDNKIATQYSPLTSYIKAMNEALEESPHLSFYISTDSDEVIEQLKEMYGEKIITGISRRRRDTGEGIVDALVDLCCLSKCNTIFGSYYSSFSGRASVMGNVPLKIIRE